LRKHRKNDMESFRRMQQLRRDCDKLRHIVQLVRHREKAKRLTLMLGNEIFEQQIHEMENPKSITRVSGIQVEEFQSFLANARNTLGDDVRKPSKRSRKDRRDRKRDRPGDGDDGFDSEGFADDPALGVAADGGASTLPLRIVPSFMEPYSARVSTLELHRQEPQFCTVSGDPISCWNAKEEHPSGYLFTCRGRIGRGGRIVFDRVRRSPHSTLDLPMVLGLGQAPPRSAVPPGMSQNSSRLVDHARLAQIYSMSDSEDEDMKKTAVSHGSAQTPAGGSKFELCV